MFIEVFLLVYCKCILKALWRLLQKQIQAVCSGRRENGMARHTQLKLLRAEAALQAKMEANNKSN